MKYEKLSALLGVQQISLHSGAFGLNQPFAKINEEQLALIENSLIEASQKSEENAEASAFEKMLTQTADAVKKAMEMAGLEKKEGLVENIQFLGEKCKEFGESKERHSLPNNNGKDEEPETLIDGYLNPNDPHNQLLKSL